LSRLTREYSLRPFLPEFSILGRTPLQLVSVRQQPADCEATARASEEAGPGCGRLRPTDL